MVSEAQVYDMKRKSVIARGIKYTIGNSYYFTSGTGEERKHVKCKLIEISDHVAVFKTMFGYNVSFRLVELDKCIRTKPMSKKRS